MARVHPPREYIDQFERRKARAGGRCDSGMDESLIGDDRSSTSSMRSGATYYPESNVDFREIDSDDYPERPSRNPWWIAFVILVTALAIAGTTTGAIALSKNSDLYDYIVNNLGPIIQFSLNITQGTALSSTVFCTESFVGVPYTSPDTGTNFSNSGIISIQRSGQLVQINLDFYPSVADVAPNPPLPNWDFPVSLENVAFYVNYSCIPPIRNWTECPDTSGVCNNVFSIFSNLRVWTTGDTVLPVAIGSVSLSAENVIVDTYTCQLLNGHHDSNDDYYLGMACALEFTNPQSMTTVSLLKFSNTFTYNTDVDSTWTVPDYCISDCFEVAF